MEFLQQLVNGLSLGSVYALIALGYTMVYGIVKLINFAHGDIWMVGAFGGFFVLTAFGQIQKVSDPFILILAFLVSMIICAILGVTIEKLCYKPLRKAPKINLLITAIGVSIVLENSARVIPWIGPNPKQYPTLQNFSFLEGLSKVIKSFTGVYISPVQILSLIVAILLMVALTYIVNYTKIGKAMRASSFDMNAARLMGINVDNIISTTFAIGAALAAASGILFALNYPQVEPYMGIMPGLKAFVAAVLGGIGSIPGAMLGGIIIGIAETLTKGYISTLTHGVISSSFADAIVFSLLIIILLVKPSGLLGKNSREKV